MDVRYRDRYNRDMTGAQISAAIRRDVKAAVAAGELPPAKYSVTLKSYSGGQSINIKVSDLPADFELFDRDFLRHEIQTEGRVFYGRDRHSAKRVALVELLEKIGDAYNFDGSDIQSDFFYVNYYLSVDVDWRYEAARRKLELESVAAELAEAENATKRRRAQREEELENANPIWLSMSRRQADVSSPFGLPRSTEHRESSSSVAPLLVTAAAAIAAHAALTWWKRPRRRRA